MFRVDGMLAGSCIDIAGYDVWYISSEAVLLFSRLIWSLHFQKDLCIVNSIFGLVQQAAASAADCTVPLSDVSCRVLQRCSKLFLAVCFVYVILLKLAGLSNIDQKLYQLNCCYQAM